MSKWKPRDNDVGLVNHERDSAFFYFKYAGKFWRILNKAHMKFMLEKDNLIYIEEN